MKPLEEAFVENVKRSSRGGRYSIRCKRGLWAVDAPDRKTAEREARHYFIQYYEDGEYGEPTDD